MTTKTQAINYRFLGLILLLSNCFGVVFLNVYALNYVFVLILFIFAFIERKKKHEYAKLIFVYLFFILLSCLYSTLFNGQNIVKTIVASYPCLGVLSYFIAAHYKLTSEKLILTIKIICIAWCCSYLLQWLIYPTILFATALNEVNITDDEFRMRMPCSICAYLLFFWGINGLVSRKNIRKNILYTLLGFLPILIMGFRSLTVLAVLCAILLITFVTKKFFKSIMFGISFLFLIYLSYNNIPIVHNKVNEMVERQEAGQDFSNSDYIRYIEYNYFTETIFVKPAERFFGGGYPVMDNSTAYGRKMYDSSYNYSMYWVDLGLIGLSFIIGISAVCLLIWMAFLMIKKCSAKDLQFIRFALLVVLVGSIVTSMELFRQGNLLIVGIILYYIENQYIPKNRIIKHQKNENRNSDISSCM